MVLLVATSIAGVITISNNSDAKISFSEEIISPKYVGSLSCDCDAENDFYCGEIDEEDRIDENDLETATGEYYLKKGCTTELTDIKFNGFLLKNNSYDMYSTNEAELNEDTCVKTSGNWTGDACEEIVIEELESTNYYCAYKDEYQDCPYGISGGIGTRCYKTEELNT